MTVKIRRRLEGPIAQLPELTPMVGRLVEITVVDESEPAISEPLTDIEALDAEQGPPPIAKFDELKGGWPLDERDDDFENSVKELRRGPWMRGTEE